LLTRGSDSVRGCLGNKGVVQLGVIETIRGSCDEDATGGDSCKVVLGKGGISHGRGMRSSKEGAVFLIGGNGMFSSCWVTGTDAGKDRGNGMVTGSSVLSIGTGGLYCSIDKYSLQCDPQGTRGSGGNVAQEGGSIGDRLVRMNRGANGDGSTGSGMTGGLGTASLGRDEDR